MTPRVHRDDLRADPQGEVAAGTDLIDGDEILFRHRPGTVIRPQDPAGLRFPEAEQEIEQGRLAAARTADQRHARACRHGEIDAPQRRHPVAIGERHLLEANRTGAAA